MSWSLSKTDVAPVVRKAVRDLLITVNALPDQPERQLAIALVQAASNALYNFPPTQMVTLEMSGTDGPDSVTTADFKLHLA